MSYDGPFIEQSHPEYGPPTPVPIIQEESEFIQLIDLYRKRRPQHVLEVGTYTGGTLFHWLQNAAPGAEVVSVDMYEDADNSHLYPDWTPEGVTCTVVRGDSHDAHTIEAAGALGPYDWIFIDAGHLESDVRADWAAYGAMATPDGVVAFHDIMLEEKDFPRVQVGRLWREIKQTQYETREIWTGGSGIGVVSMCKHDWLPPHEVAWLGVWNQVCPTCLYEIRVPPPHKENS